MHFLYLMLAYFKKYIFAAYENGATIEITVFKWFAS